jgi:predicted Fe-S protein YdhL (DUF1289 family)
MHDIAELKKAVSYDPETGIFYRLTPSRPVFGSKHQRGFLRGMINKNHYMLHRLAVAFMNNEWPDKGMVVDHINGDPSDNRAVNLRICTKSQNGMNRNAPKNSKTGVKGVTPYRGLYRATISVDGKWHLIGCFRTIEEAANARTAASAKFHGEFGRESRLSSPSDFEAHEKKVSALLAAWASASDEAREEFLLRINRRRRQETTKAQEWATARQAIGRMK